MKRNYLTLAVGLILVLIFGTLLFSFQVRQTEVALLTTFGKPTRDIHDPGLYLKLPWPIQRVQKFDKRIHNFEDRDEQTITRDGYHVRIMTYLGWSITDPAIFRERFDGSTTRAQGVLEGFARTAKNAVVGRHPFSSLISTDTNQLKFVEIESEMLDIIRPLARQNGMEVNFIGIKTLGLPEAITRSVFDRMREERQRHVQRLQAEGESRAAQIRSEADRERTIILSKAQAEASRIRGRADAEAAPFYAELEQSPELAIFLMRLNALEISLKERATLMLDTRTSPYDLLNGLPPVRQLPEKVTQPVTAPAPETSVLR
jgi:modulator of FtsH protease HflC